MYTNKVLKNENNMPRSKSRRVFFMYVCMSVWHIVCSFTVFRTDVGRNKLRVYVNTNRIEHNPNVFGFESNCRLKMQRYLLNIAYLGTRYKWVMVLFVFCGHSVFCPSEWLSPNVGNCNTIFNSSGLVHLKNAVEQLSIEARLADAIKRLKPKNNIDISVSSRWT